VNNDDLSGYPSSYCYREGIDPSSKVLPCDFHQLYWYAYPSCFCGHRGSPCVPPPVPPLAVDRPRQPTPDPGLTISNWTMTMVMIFKIITIVYQRNLPTFAKSGCNVALRKFGLDELW
jgi:hypothetical protein